jgi:hypothetical protein
VTLCEGKRSFRAASTNDPCTASGEVLLEHIDRVAVIVDDENGKATKRAPCSGHHVQG